MRPPKEVTRSLFMRCETCVLSLDEGSSQPLPSFLETVSACGDCSVAERVPEVRALLARQAELSRAFRRMEQTARRWEFRCRELEELTHESSERISTLERVQGTSLGEVEQELRDKLALIEIQQAEIRELSVPLLRVAERALAVPLIGVLDEERAQLLSDKLLKAISLMDIRFAVVDLTGLLNLDQRTAGYLTRLFHAVALLGGAVVVTGVQGHIARAMIAEGVLLSGIRVEKNLRDALLWCQQAERKERSMR
jgi:anti-anti-sigma regulatory factor